MDPSYDPAPAAVQHDRPTTELFQQPLFKKQRQELYGMDDEETFMVEQAEDWQDNLVCSLDLELPQTKKEWKLMKRSPTAFFVRKAKGVEVKWHLLSPEEKQKFEIAKQAEVNQWLKAQAVRRVQGAVPHDRVVKMRWVLTHKESGAAKGRIVLIGYQDPDLGSSLVLRQ